MQVADTDEFGLVQVEDLKEVSQDKKIGKVVPARKQYDRCTNELHDTSPAGTNHANDQAVCQNSKKRGRKAKERVGAICPGEKAGSAVGISLDSNEESEDMFKTSKRGKKFRAASVGAETLDDGNKDKVTELPASLGKKKRRKGDYTTKSGKNCNKILVENQTQKPVSSKKQRLDSMQNDSEQVSTGRNQINKDTIAELSALLVPLANKEKASDSMKKPGKFSRKAKSNVHGMRGKRNSKLSCSSNSKDESADDIQAGYADNLHANDAHTTGNIQNNRDVRSLADPSTQKKLPSLTNNVVLQRCQNILGQVQCAFCLSSEESEVFSHFILILFHAT